MRLVALLPLLYACTAHAQHVLHFTATSGFDHGTREVSLAMFSAIGGELGIEVVDDPAGTSFSDAMALAQFDVVVFSNTSGNNILDPTQRSNFEDWVNAGGHVMGIHAASDTYRHSTANGNSTGTWDFYAELIGASVQEDPNHVDGTPAYIMEHIGLHASTANIPDPWLKNEEYYYWENGYYDPANNVVLEVEQTVGPNGLVNSYDAARPMSWYRALPEGNRVFYTALGHAQSSYTDDLLFRQHIEDALDWMLFGTTGIAPVNDTWPFTVVNDGRSITITTSKTNGTIRIVDATGRSIYEAASNGHHRVDVHDWANGPYHIRVGRDVRTISITR